MRSHHDLDRVVGVFAEHFGDAVTTGVEVAPYTRPWRGPAGATAMVLRPRSRAQALDMAQLAAEEAITLIPQGANTGLVGAGVPDGSGAQAILSTDRLQRVIALADDGSTIEVEAGARLSSIQAALAPLHRWLPVDVSSDPSIGGMTATDAAGTRAFRYGPTGHHVTAVEAIVGSPPRRGWMTSGLEHDSANPPLWRALVSSGGTLGLITAVRVRSSPIPASTAVAWLGCSSPQQLDDARRFLSASPDVTALEMIGANTLDEVCRDDGPPHPFGVDRPAFCVLAEVSSHDGGASERLLSLAEQLDRTGVVQADDVRIPPPAQAWALRHAVSPTLARRGHVTGCDLAVPPSTLVAVLSGLESVVRRHRGAVLCPFGHLGTGGIHANVLWTAPPSPSTEAQLRDDVYEWAVDHGGTFSAEHGVGPYNVARWASARTAAERRLYFALKDALDPGGVWGHPRPRP